MKWHVDKMTRKLMMNEKWRINEMMGQQNDPLSIQPNNEMTIRWNDPLTKWRSAIFRLKFFDKRGKMIW
jgi:hypothetical protein